MPTSRSIRLTLIAAVCVSLDCGGRDATRTSTAQSTTPAQPATTPPADCPPDGSWHECSVLKSLERAGLGVRRDSVPARDPAIAQPGLLLHIGPATLEVFLFADEAARKSAQQRLDTTRFVRYDQDLTVRADRSLIGAANLLAILDSKRDAQRQRVGDALTAGAPQPGRR